MTDARLAGILPKGDPNGLNTILKDLIENPHHQHLLVVIADCSKTTIDNDSGETIPTARILNIEVIARPADRATAEKLLRRAFEERTGLSELPFAGEAGQ